MLVSYAQNLEDILLHRVLGSVSHGFYVDVGAYDPLTDSVTKLFYEKGWHGINIEASPTRHKRMVEDRPRDINLNVAASDRAGTIMFHEIVDTGLSTTVEEVARRHLEAGHKKNSYTIQATTLAAICDTHAAREVHFLKIDVEGAEEAVIRGTDLERHRPWVILVEATEPLTDIPTHDRWENLILRHGYRFVAFDGLNRFYLAAEHDELAPHFIVPADNYRRAVDIWTQAHLEGVVLTQQGELGRTKSRADRLARENERVTEIASQRDRWIAAALPEVSRITTTTRKSIVYRLRAKPRLDKARTAANAGRWELAARYYREALEADAKQPAVWVQFGHALKEAGVLAAAEQAYRKALTLQENDPDAHVQLGHALFLQGRRGAATECYLRAIELGPGNGPARDILLALGWTPAQLGCTPETTEPIANPILVNRFTDVYRRNLWADHESKSGAGSRKNSPSVVAAMSALTIVRDKIDFHSINDIPCGDFNWIHHFLNDFPNI